MLLKSQKSIIAAKIEVLADLCLNKNTENMELTKQNFTIAKKFKQLVCSVTFDLHWTNTSEGGKCID